MMTSAKRSAEEAFLKHRSGSATDNQSIPPSSRISLISSSSSSSSFTTSSSSSSATVAATTSSQPLRLRHDSLETSGKGPFHNDVVVRPWTKRGGASDNITITNDGDDATTIHDNGFVSGGPIGATIRLRNARILQRDGTLLHGSIDLSNGIITNVSFVATTTTTHHRECQVEECSRGDNEIIVQVIDCQNHILSPGYIDIQLNGAFGVDFSNDGSGSNNDSENNNTSPSGRQTSTTYTTRGGLNEHDILKVAQHLVRSGVTSFCPTMVSSSPQTYRRIIPLIRNARNLQQKELLSLQRHQQQQQPTKHDVIRHRGIGANILGMHLEGPFFAPSRNGAHDLQHICAPIHGISTVKEVYGLNHDNSIDHDIISPSLEDIDIITLAPELPGAFDAIQSLTRFDNRLPLSTSSSTSSSSSTTNQHQLHSVVVSCGHTNATYEEGKHALKSGATLITHLFNAMNPFHHRSPGLVGLLSSSSSSSSTKLDPPLGVTTKPYYSLIVDGIHVHESAVSMAYQCHPHGCILVTDAMAAMGLGDGLHSLGNMKVCTKGDYATVAGSDSTLAGSVVSMDTCVKRFKQFTACSIGEALLCATLHPAMVLKRHRQRTCGREEGFTADRHDEGSSSAMLDAPIGILEVGARADVILVNEELDVLATWVAGYLAFQSSSTMS